MGISIDGIGDIYAYYKDFLTRAVAAAEPNEDKPEARAEGIITNAILHSQKTGIGVSQILDGMPSVLLHRPAAETGPSQAVRTHSCG